MEFDFTKTETADLIERRKAIGEESNSASGDALDALEKELDAINAELETRKAAEKKRQEIRQAVASGAGAVVETVNIEERKEKTMTFEEFRSSKAYVDAYARYIKTGKDDECRALLTSNVAEPPEGSSGPLPVPTIVEERVRASWSRNGLLDLVRRTYVRGNLQVGFELSATGAAVHAEGDDAPAEEVLTLGVVSLIPQSIKKWIRISDEAMDLGGEEFLNYIYDEITNKIAKEAQRLLVTAITGAPAASTATQIGVPVITGAPSLPIVAQAVANLGDDASNIAVVMNRLTHADFVAAIAANGFMFDPFEGYAVHYDNTLPAYSAATAGQKWMIVGDFDGAQMNFPNGQDIRLKFDDLTEAESDLVKIVGRMFVAIGITAPGRFVTVAKGN